MSRVALDWTPARFLLAGLFAVAVLAIHVPAASVSADGPDTDPVVFPAPPETPRIRYVETISDNASFKPTKSWWRRALTRVIGEKGPVPIVRPYGLETTDDALYVCDPGAGVVHRFRYSDKSYFRIPGKGTLPSPIDAAADGGGNLYVTDSRLAEVHCYDENGDLLRKLDGEFQRPTGIAFHRGSNRLFVVDTKAHRVLMHGLDGRRLGSFGDNGTGEGQFNFPTAISVGADGLLYVTDSMNFRVQVFDVDGSFVRTFGRLGDGPGDFSKPKGVATDSDGNVYVVDAIFDAVQIFNQEGALLLSFGRGGRRAGEFWLPSGIAVDDRDRIYVADSYNNRIQVFQYLGQ